MVDNISAQKRSWTMRQVPSKDSAPEIVVRQALHAAGFRFRVHRKDLPGNPDLILPMYRLAVFVHGCFWHWHGCKRSRMPSANREYWVRKIDRNVTRDAANERALRALGWQACIVWECELSEGIRKLLKRLRRRRRVLARTIRDRNQ